MNNHLSSIATDKPLIYTSFVSTIDGKIFVHKPGYWPIGSSEDYKRFTHLRAHADIIIDGKNTALAFADRTIETIHGEMFQSFRKELGISNLPAYGVITNTPDQELIKKFENQFGFKPFIITKNKNFSSQNVTVVHVTGGLSEIVAELFEKGYKKIFIDGGPTLITSLIEENLLDEIFLTLAPKIFGSEHGVTQTLAEGKLLPPDMSATWKIKSVDQIGNELFIHYAKK